MVTQPAKESDSASKKQPGTQRKKLHSHDFLGARRRYETGRDAWRRTDTHRDATRKRVKS
jgi:hypothetical protein